MDEAGLPRVVLIVPRTECTRVDRGQTERGICSSDLRLTPTPKLEKGNQIHKRRYTQSISMGSPNRISVYLAQRLIRSVLSNDAALWSLLLS